MDDLGEREWCLEGVEGRSAETEGRVWKKQFSINKSAKLQGA